MIKVVTRNRHEAFACFAWEAFWMKQFQMTLFLGVAALLHLQVHNEYFKYRYVLLDNVKGEECFQKAVPILDLKWEST